jgi:hypothetical protein
MTTDRKEGQDVMLMEHETTILADYYAKQIQSLIDKGPQPENGGWEGLVYGVRCAAKRIVDLTSDDEQ